MHSSVLVCENKCKTHGWLSKSSQLPAESQGTGYAMWEGVEEGFAFELWFVCVCASMLSVSLSCVHSQLWLVPIPSIPSITLTIISTPAASPLQLAVISTTRAAHGPLAHPCPFQTGPIPQVRDEDRAPAGNIPKELASWDKDRLVVPRRIWSSSQGYLFIMTFLLLTQICFCKIHPIFLPKF